VIVGAGPAGLSAGDPPQAANPESAWSWWRGLEVGAHILSGAVIDPIGLDRLLPEWRSEDPESKRRSPTTASIGLGLRAGLRVPNFLLPR